MENDGVQQTNTRNDDRSIRSIRVVENENDALNSRPLVMENDRPAFVGNGERSFSVCRKMSTLH